MDRKQLKQFIMDEFLPGNHAGDLPDDLNLLENGILDSLAVLKLVAHIENTYNVSLEPEEIDPENLNSVNAIYDIVQSKTAGAP